MILNKYYFSWFALFLIVLISACEKEEIPIQPRNPGDSQVNEVALGPDYKNQIFFDLGSNAVISHNLKIDWDLAFESSAEGTHITLNSSRGMALSKSDLTFADLTTHSGADWTWDKHSGYIDSTAFANWEENEVYLLDLGYSHTGTHMGYCKLKMGTVSETEYTFEVGGLEDATGKQVTVTKNITNLLTFYSIAQGEVTIAPENTSYDLVFTQYTHVFPDPETPYLVTGVLLNRFETYAGIFHGKAYDAITRADAEAMDLSDQLNTIGYDWKFYNYEEGVYTVDTETTYIIQSNEGLFYKLRFTGFYNTEGLKGYPNFEFQQL